MSTLIDVPLRGLADAICTAVRDWSDAAEAGQLRITPNPLNSKHYLVLANNAIVATVRVIDPVDSETLTNEASDDAE